MLRVFSFQRVQKLFYPKTASLNTRLDQAQIVRLITSASGTTSWTDNCLVRALGICYFLRKNGSAVQVQLGVKVSPEKTLIAHAWIEDADGEVVTDEVEAIKGNYYRFKQANELT